MPPQQTRPYKYWIIIFLLVLYLIPVSFIAFGDYFKSTAPKLSAPSSNEFFDIQTAMVNGKITNVSGNNIEVENTKGLKGTVELSKNLIINDLINPLATPSGDLKKIQTGKNAQIVLNLIDGKYQAVTINFQSISYLPDQIAKTNTIPDTQTPSTSSAIPGPLPSIPLVPSITPIQISSPP